MDDIEEFEDISPFPSVSPQESYEPSPKLALGGNSHAIIHKLSCRHQPPKSYTSLTKEHKTTDWYSILSVDRNVSQKELKAAYHRKCLETHPDKDTTREDEAFKKIKKAYDFISQPNSRRAFDSIMEFDDSFPTAKCYETSEQFFDDFGPVFQRNAYWCVKSPPLLGGATTSDDEVDDFYDFWFSFRSWRDFSHVVDPVEFEGDEEDRETRRRVQRENDRQHEKLRRQELKRVSSIVEKAFKLDPRVRSRAQRHKEKREMEAKERSELRKLEQEKLREAMENAEIERKTVQEKRAAQEKADRENRTRMVAHILEITKGMNLISESTIASPRTIPRKNFDLLSKSTLNLEKLLSQVQGIQNDPKHGDARSQIRDVLQETFSQLSSHKNGDRDLNGQVSTPWSESELLTLQKAVAKYPRGTIDRWEQMAAYVGKNRTSKEVREKVTEIEHSWGSFKAAVETAQSTDLRSTSKPDVVSESADTWTSLHQKQFEDALRSLKDYTGKDKWDLIASKVNGKSRASCIARYKQLARMRA